jgi:Bax protein
MRQITYALKSSKVATVVALGTIGIYALTQFADHPSHYAEAKLSDVPLGALTNVPFDEGKFDVAAIPTPAPRPGDLPNVKQPDQLTVTTVMSGLENVSFHLPSIRDGSEVPRYFVPELPVDILDVNKVSTRKNLFISVTLPLILNANEKILEERKILKNLIKAKNEGQSWSSEQLTWVRDLAKRYKGSARKLDNLLQRVDIVPASLALAQSIEESGWGTSRFAREGNALFGQRVWSEGKGIVPHERADGEDYEVRRFERLAKSVSSYALNLNRHEAYQKFRDARARLRSVGLLPNGYALAASLTSYSERGGDYVESLRMLMRSNDLGQYDTANLAPKQVAQSERLSSN